MTICKRSILWVSFSISLTALAPEAGAAVCGCDAVAPTNLKAALPLPGILGQISQVSDQSRGLWLNEAPNRWVQIGGLVNVQDFGALGDGASDDTVAIQNAINSLSLGGTLYFPATLPAAGAATAYVITNTLMINGVQGLNLVGAGRQATAIQWGSGAHVPHAGVPMILIQNGFLISIKSMAITGTQDAAHAPSAIIESKLDTTLNPPSQHYSSLNTFEDLVINGAGTAAKGIVYDKANASADNANGEGSFDRVEIASFTKACVSFENTQSKAHTFVDCRFLYCTRGVATNLNPAAPVGGSFVWYGGTVTGNSVADFDLGSPDDAIVISGFNSEGSGRLLQTTGPTSAGWPITIQGVRWAGSGLAADGHMIVHQSPGPLTVTGSILGDGWVPALGAAPTIFLNYAVDGTANIVGNEFGWANSVNTNPISYGGAGPWRVVMQGNTFMDAFGSAKLRSDPSTVIGPYAGMLGLSSTLTPANNMSGDPTQAAGAPGANCVVNAGNTCTVTFKYTETNVNYDLSITPSGFAGAPAAGSNRVKSIAKATTGFTVTTEAAVGAGATQTFDWHLFR